MLRGFADMANPPHHKLSANHKIRKIQVAEWASQIKFFKMAQSRQIFSTSFIRLLRCR